MESCNPCFCAAVNGQFTNASCPEQDCYKYCKPVSNTGAQPAYDIRTVPCAECNSVFTTQEAQQQCSVYCKMPASSPSEYADSLDLPNEEEAKQTNKQILGIAALVIILIILAAIIYYY